MATPFEIDDGFIAEQNEKARAWVEEDYTHLAKALQRRNVSIQNVKTRVLRKPGATCGNASKSTRNATASPERV